MDTISVCLMVTVNNITNHYFSLHFLLLSSHISLRVNKLVCMLVTSFVNFYFSLRLLTFSVIVRGRQHLIKIYVSFHAV